MKFWAVTKHEYKKIVMKWSFLIGTLLFPVIGAGLAIVPAILLTLKGEPMRIVVIDPSNKIAPRLKANLSVEKMNERFQQLVRDSAYDLTASQEERMKQGAQMMAEGLTFIDYDASGKAPEDVRADLNRMAANGEIDGYLIVPPDVTAGDARYEFISRKAGDFIATDMIRDAINEAVRSQRLADANISEDRLRELSRNVVLDSKAVTAKGEEKDGESLFIASMVIGLMIYITLTIYGQVILGAVVEEKETRLAEILFSSARPFELLAGKLVGVGLAGLTQLAIWVGSLVALFVVMAAQADMAPVMQNMPNITPLMILYFFIFFLVGYFIYASIFAVIGAMVTTVQEGGQFAFPPIMIMLAAFYFSFAVIRDPSSDLSFWVSIAPLLAPMTMPVRILGEMPPFWQIALAIALNVITIIGIVWVAGRVYRIGMLMYGKRATIPEMLRWIRQS
jgi:ABC-2 type transport system permease protein